MQQDFPRAMPQHPPPFLDVFPVYQAPRAVGKSQADFVILLALN